MSSETWRNISTVFLVLGILFLVVTVAFSVKFQLFSIIKSEIELKKERRNMDTSDYLDNAVSDSRAVKEDKEITQDSVENQKIRSDTYSFDNVSDDRTVYEEIKRSSEQIPSATVIVSRESQNSGTVIASETERQSQPVSIDFVIKNSIIVIHGDPSVIKRF